MMMMMRSFRPATGLTLTGSMDGTRREDEGEEAGSVDGPAGRPAPNHGTRGINSGIPARTFLSPGHFHPLTLLPGAQMHPVDPALVLDPAILPDPTTAAEDDSDYEYEYHDHETEVGLRI